MRFSRFICIAAPLILVALSGWPLLARSAGDACEACNRAEVQALEAAESYNDAIVKITQRVTPRIKEPAKTSNRVFDGIFLFDIRSDKKSISVSAVNSPPDYVTPMGVLGNLLAASRGIQPVQVQVTSSETPAPAPSGLPGWITDGPAIWPTFGPGVFPVVNFVPLADFPAAANFQDAISIVRKHASKLTRDEKLVFLNRLGVDLAKGYDHGVADSNAFGQKTSMDQLFNNLRTSGTNGGVCRDISSYLAEMARALGFQNVGTHTGLAGDTAQKSGAHVVSHFRDPESGEYYMQNYGKLFNTHQKTLQGAVDVSTRVMNSLSGVSYVESLPGKVHQYTPKMSRWAQGQINAVAERQKDPAFVTAKISDRETTLGFQYQVQGKGNTGAEKMTKAFFLRSEVDTNEGPVRLQAIGVAGELSRNVKLSQSVLDEVGYIAKGQFGYLEIRDRQVDPDADMVERKRRNAFLGGNVVGKARINQVTGKLELDAKVLDLWTKTSVGAPMSGIENKLVPSVEYRLAKPVTVEVGRALEIVPTDQYSSLKMQTAYDKVNVVVDRRGSDDKVVVLSKSEAYLFGGAENRDAVALRQLFSVAVPTEKKGEFAILMDLSKIVENRSKDPFYDLPVSSKIRGEWKMALNRLIEIGTGVEARYGSQPFFLFEEPGAVTPDLTVRKKEVKGDLWLRMKF